MTSGVLFPIRCHIYAFIIHYNQEGIRVSYKSLLCRRKREVIKIIPSALTLKSEKTEGVCYRITVRYFLLPKNMYSICRIPSRNVLRCDPPLRPSGLRVTGISAIFAPDRANLPIISVANSIPPQESPNPRAFSRSKPRSPQ